MKGRVNLGRTEGLSQVSAMATRHTGGVLLVLLTIAGIPLSRSGLASAAPNDEGKSSSRDAVLLELSWSPLTCNTQVFAGL